MSAPVIIGEPCGCQVLDDPDITSGEFLRADIVMRDRLTDWLTRHLDSWEMITSIAWSDGVLAVEEADAADVHHDHVAHRVLTLNTERPPVPPW